ncbi:MAG: serine--tRNA ligase [Bacteroidales bacterium]|nr:serine--tRNA ligase [Lentimicrobiaceae bacterium]MDD5694680.1 serine--tRNA ligase [Bacteroidales bacterium]
MLELSFIRDHRQEVIQRLGIKNFKAIHLVDEIQQVDSDRRKIQKTLDDILAESNQAAREIGILYKSGRVEEASELKEKTAVWKVQSRELGERLTETENRLNDLLVQLPNLPHASVPRGYSAEQNENVYQEGALPDLGPEAMPHWDLIRRYDIIDFELGNKVTGAGFPFYKGKGAKLQRALITFFLESAVKAGYLEIQPPLLVNADSGYGTGQLPDKDGQMYLVTEENYYLIPTAEVPITNMYRNVILPAESLPVKNVAYSNCFRREAGSWGKDVRGLNRLHQFDKVEIVQIVHPDKSYEALEEMRTHVAGLLHALQLPFRIMKLCGGDLSFTSALTYDFEVYSAAQARWLEVSSVSNFESFQSNRMKLRFKDQEGKTRLAHTLNGSALALPRVVAALLENNQGANGMTIPEVLVPYTGFGMI